MKSPLFIPFQKSWNISHTISFFHTPYLSQPLYLTKRNKGYYSWEEYFNTFREAYKNFKKEILRNSHMRYNPQLFSAYCTSLKSLYR